MQKTIVLNPKDWERYLALRSAANAFEAKAKALEQSLGFPDPKEIAIGFGLKTGDSTTLPIVSSKDNAPLGKLSIFWYPGARIPANWRKRIS